MGIYKLGKLDPDPIKIAKALHFANYVPAVLPAIPGSFSNLSNVYASLGMSSKDFPTLFPMDGNGPDNTLKPPLGTDGYGDCVAVMFAKYKTICAALVGQKVIPDSNDIVNTYLKLSGGDNGLSIADTLDYAIKNGLFGEKPVAKVFIQPGNWDHMRLAMYMFGGLCVGIQCTDAMLAQFDSGQPWDGTGTVEGGHGILLPDFADDGSVEVLTWGGIIQALPSSFALMDEGWALASAELASNPTKFSALGFNVDQFLADLQAIQDQEQQ